MELWDAYRKDGSMAGITLVRGQPIPKGLYHLVCEVLVRHTDGSYLCMKRSLQKPNYPSYWEATAGGSALKGETALQSVERELWEETGLKGTGFHPVACHLIERDDRCIFYSYVCTVDCEKSAVRLQPGETEDFCWMDEAQFMRFINSGRMIPPQMQRYCSYWVKKGYVMPTNNQG